jgi:hypothetical protein
VSSRREDGITRSSVACKEIQGRDLPDHFFKHRADTLISPSGLDVIQTGLAQKMTHQPVRVNAPVTAGGFAQQYPDLSFQQLGREILQELLNGFGQFFVHYASKFSGIQTVYEIILKNASVF